MKRGLGLVWLCALLALCGCAADDNHSDDDEQNPDDDDSGDDDDDDDDQAPDDPYAGMEPRGLTIDELLAISTHTSKSVDPSWTRDFELDRLKRAGVGLLRTDFSWSSIEPSDDQFNFAGYDVLVDQCLENGVAVDALLDYGVGWAMPGGGHSEIEPAVWADFAGSVAAHYAERIDLYEIWNEENLARFWKPEPDPEHYGELLAAGHEAIHENDPTATVLFGGLAAWVDGMISPDGLWEYLVRVWEVHPDVCQHFDGLAIHPYTFAQQTRPEQDVQVLFWIFPGYATAIGQARGLLERIGCPDKPIYLTETGWPDYYIGRESQAAFLARGLLIAAQQGVAAWFWYTFWDGRGNTEMPTEDRFGLFTWPGEEPQPKPDYAALAGAHDVLGASRYAGDLAAAAQWPADHYGLTFSDGQGIWTVALWLARFQLDQGEIVNVPLHPDATGEWELYDQQGVLLQSGGASQGAVQVYLDGQVRYLRFQVE